MMEDQDHPETQESKGFKNDLYNLAGVLLLAVSLYIPIVRTLTFYFIGFSLLLMISFSAKYVFTESKKGFIIFNYFLRCAVLSSIVSGLFFLPEYSYEINIGILALQLFSLVFEFYKNHIQRKVDHI